MIGAIRQIASGKQRQLKAGVLMVDRNVGGGVVTSGSEH